MPSAQLCMSGGYRSLYRVQSDVTAGTPSATHRAAVQGHVRQAEAELAAIQVEVQTVDGTSQQCVLALRSALSTLQQVLARVQKSEGQAQEEAQAAASHARPGARCSGHHICEAAAITVIDLHSMSTDRKQGMAKSRETISLPKKHPLLSGTAGRFL